MERATEAAGERTGGAPRPGSGGPTGAPSRRWATQAAGWSLLVVGGALLVLPGPGLPLVVAGLALLEKDQPWARRLLDKVRLQGERGRSLIVRVLRRFRSDAV